MATSPSIPAADDRTQSYSKEEFDLLLSVSKKAHEEADDLTCQYAGEDLSQLRQKAKYSSTPPDDKSTDQPLRTSTSAVKAIKPRAGDTIPDDDDLTRVYVRASEKGKNEPSNAVVRRVEHTLGSVIVQPNDDESSAVTAIVTRYARSSNGFALWACIGIVINLLIWSAYFVDFPTNSAVTTWLKSAMAPLHR